MDVLPNQTLYINNLYEKLPKEELKKTLYALFSQFGKILDVVALKTSRMRGQAWVVFSDLPAATNALRNLQSFPFFDKPLRIAYAKGKSDAVAELDGTYKDSLKARAKRSKDKDARSDQQPNKREKGAAGAPVRKTAPSADADGPPNRILFAQNLPEGTTQAMVSMLFTQFPGFREVRMVEAKPGIAFIEYESEHQAGVAQQGLNNFKLTASHAMRVMYAKA